MSQELLLRRVAPTIILTMMKNFRFIDAVSLRLNSNDILIFIRAHTSSQENRIIRVDQANY